MSALTVPLPRKSSRTRTQAIRVPMTASTSATIAEETTVSSSAVTARRPEIAVQNVSRPPSKDLTTTAASGSRTMSDSHATADAPAAADPHGSGPRAERGRARFAAAVSVSLGSGDSQVLLDLGHGAGRRIEELVVDLGPAAEIVDREQLLGRRELLGVEDLLVDRAVALGRV